MTPEQEDQLYAEAGRLHERARGQNRPPNDDEKQRLAEISLLLAGGSEEEVQALRRKTALVEVRESAADHPANGADKSVPAQEENTAGGSQS